MSDAAHLLWALVACFAVWRWASVAELAIRHRAPAPPHTALGQVASTAVPEDLVALALTHSETWAQEDTLKAMREKYESTGNWNAVRSAFGVGRIDEEPS